MTADSKQTGRGEESVLSRWSRRKLESRQQQADAAVSPVEATPENLPTPAENAAAATPAPEQPVLTDADMPDVDSLDENSDYSQFMSAGVSDKLRNLALRKLFHAPSFNIRDGLDEYDDDFTSFEKLGDIVTSDMKHQIEMQQKKLREALAEETSPDEVAELEPGERESGADEPSTEDGETASPEADKLARLDEQSGEPDADDQ